MRGTQPDCRNVDNCGTKGMLPSSLIVASTGGKTCCDDRLSDSLSVERRRPARLSSPWSQQACSSVGTKNDRHCAMTFPFRPWLGGDDNPELMEASGGFGRFELSGFNSLPSVTKCRTTARHDMADEAVAGSRVAGCA